MSNLNAKKFESDDNPVSGSDNVDVDVLRQAVPQYVHRRHQGMTVQPVLHFSNEGFGDQRCVEPLGDEPSDHAIVPLVGASLP